MKNQHGDVLGLKILVPAIVFLLSCKTPSRSNPKVTNGLEIGPEEHSAVVSLSSKDGFGQCSGTFVTPRAVLTAGHCVSPFQEKALPYRFGVKATATSIDSAEVEDNTAAEAPIIVHPAFAESGFKISPYDIALIAFTSDRSTNVAAIQGQRPEVGQTVEIVGYGNNDNVAKTGSDKKRKGSNVLRKVEGGHLFLSGVSGNVNGENPDGKDALAGAGDSGGPLFIDGRQAGVAHAGSEAEARYIDLHSLDSKRFFLYLEKLGLNIPVPDVFLDEVRDETLGFYRDASGECTLFLFPVGNATLIVEPMSPGCAMEPNLPSFDCAETECRNQQFILERSEIRRVTLSGQGLPTRNLEIIEMDLSAVISQQHSLAKDWKPTRSASADFRKWKSGEPDQSGQCIKIADTGKWEDANCDERFLAACWRFDGKWGQSFIEVPGGSDVRDWFCSPIAAFSLPQNENENKELANYMKAKGIPYLWINLKP